MIRECAKQLAEPGSITRVDSELDVCAQDATVHGFTSSSTSKRRRREIFGFHTRLSYFFVCNSNGFNPSRRQIMRPQVSHGARCVYSCLPSFPPFLPSLPSPPSFPPTKFPPKTQCEEPWAAQRGIDSRTCDIRARGGWPTGGGGGADGGDAGRASGRPCGVGQHRRPQPSALKKIFGRYSDAIQPPLGLSRASHGLRDGQLG